MKKIKITETQNLMLESMANAKLKLAESGGISIPRSQSPSSKITGEFKTAKIKGFKAEAAKTPQTNTEINWNELVTNVHEFLKQLYTNPTKEGLNPYWETIGITWDELVQMLTAVNIIKSVSGGYRLTKIVNSPTKAVKIVAKLVEKMVKDKVEVPVEEIEQKDITGDYFKKQIGEPKKSGKSRAELLAVIATKRAESQKQTTDFEAKRDAENNASVVDEGDWFDNHPDHPAKQVDNTRLGSRPKESPFNIVWYHQDIAIFEKDSKFYAYNVESADSDEYVNYANREGTPMGRDEDGMMDVEYSDWDMDENVVNAYVNDNYKHLSFGKGLDEWENGVEMVEITRDLAEEFTSLGNYIKGPTGEHLLKVLSSINLEETTTTGSVGGSFVGQMGGGAPIAKSNVASEMKTTIEEEDNSVALKSDIITSITPFVKHSPDSSMLFWMNNEAKLKEIVDNITSLGDDEWMLMVQFIIKALQAAETYIDKKDENGINRFQHSIGGLNNFVKHFSTHIGEVTTVTSVGGDSGTFAYDAPVGDGGKFWTAGNKMNKKSVKETSKAFTDTQYPNGGFVEFDDCTKLNNNKKAQNGGCSTGVVDNVVKTKSSKNSVISDPSIYESVAKATRRTIEEVKNILSEKNNKSN